MLAVESSRAETRQVEARRGASSLVLILLLLSPFFSQCSVFFLVPLVLLTRCRLCRFPVAATGHKRLSFWRLLLYGLLACTSLRHDTSRLCHAPTLSRLPRPLLLCCGAKFVLLCLLYVHFWAAARQQKPKKKPTHTHTQPKIFKKIKIIKKRRERRGQGVGGGGCRGKYLIKQRHVVGGRFRRHFLHMQRRLCCLLHLLPRPLLLAPSSSSVTAVSDSALSASSRRASPRPASVGKRCDALRR